MKLAFFTWAATFSGLACLAQTPPSPAPPKPAGQTPAVVVPSTPFESSPNARPVPATSGSRENPAASPSATPPSSRSQPTVGADAGSADPRTPAKKPYVIGPLDVLDVRVWNDPKLSGIFDVRPDGVFSMNLIGEIRADGLTVPQVTDAIIAKLSDLINAPEVNVQVVRYNSKKYYVFGEVNRTGEFPLVSDTTVLDALSNTGGFREFANQKKIYVLRGDKKLKFNYKDVSNGKHMETNVLLENGDRIFVP